MKINTLLLILFIITSCTNLNKNNLINENDTFLKDYNNYERKEELYKYFEEVKKISMQFLITNDKFYPITEVIYSNKDNFWAIKGNTSFISYNPDSDEGTLFHEIFHSIFHVSFLHNGSDDEKWGEAFCDAFRYFTEYQVLKNKESNWFLKIDRFSNLSYEEIMLNSTDQNYDKKYAYPASLIIKSVNKDFNKFKESWEYLNNKKIDDNVCNTFFKYDINKGEPIN
jgi:hypothetical protein